MTEQGQKTFMIQLMPHQVQAVEWLRSRSGRGLLWMAAGTGKTFSTLAYLKDEGCKNVLVLCPPALIAQWKGETAAFFGEVPETFAFANYERLLNDDIMRQFLKVKWDAVIADESQLVNNPSAKRTRRLKKIPSPRRIALSGTPLPNALHECWSVCDWIEPGCLHKSWWHFRTNECKVHPAFPKIVGYHDEAKIRRVVERLSFRVGREVLADLPGTDREVVSMSLGAGERERYLRLRDECIIELAAEKRLTVTHVLTKLLRLRQLVDFPSLLMDSPPSAKEAVLDKLIAASGEPTIVFTEWPEQAHALAIRWYGAFIAGGQAADEREAQIRHFKSGNTPLLFSTSAGNLGLNLQEASRVIHYSLPWNAARLEQRLARAWRKGQTKEVKEIVVLAEDTVDEYMWRLIGRKDKLDKSFTREDFLDVLHGRV